MNFRLTPGRAGIIGAFFSIQFFLTFVILGFLQPGYNHLRTTISTLAVGEFGWIQTVNFVFLALSFVFIGFGLGKNITHKNINKIFAIFLTSAIGLMAVALIPTDKLDPQEVFQFDILSTTGRIHYFIALGLILLTPLMFYQIIKSMRKSSIWKSFIPYTLCVLIFNFVIGVSWFYLVNKGYLVEWKGLIQKILATNALIWLAIVGHRLWMFDSYSKLEKK